MLCVVIYALSRKNLYVFERRGLFTALKVVPGRGMRATQCLARYASDGAYYKKPSDCGKKKV